MKQVLVNVTFRDRYNSTVVYEAGKTYPMSEERIKEVKEVNPNFITVVGNVEEAVPVKEEPVKEAPEEEKSEDDSEDEAPEEEKVEEPPVEKPKKGKK